MTRAYDAIIVGGGHNGLTCGAYLARAGKSVLVLEQKPYVGGASVTEEFSPGFRASTYSFIMGHLHPKVIEELELRRFGLQNIEQPNVFNPTEDDGIVFSKDPVKTREQIARFSKKDAENYPKFFARLQSTIEILRRLQLETPVNPFRKDLRGILTTVGFAWRYRNAETEVYNLLRALSMSAHDYVSRWFETDLVKAKFMFLFQGGVTPYELRNSDWEREKPNMVRNAFRVMDRFAPGFSDSVIDCKLYTPRDIEADINLPGGNSQHGELTLDQLFFMRPVPNYADYRSPVRNLYQCGASTHPGGAVSAVPGHNAAREILRDWR